MVDRVVKDDLKKTVLSTMKAHIASVEIQTLACNVLGNTAMIGMQSTLKHVYFCHTYV